MRSFKFRTNLDPRLAIILLIVFVQYVGASMVLPILPIYATKRFAMSYEVVTLLNASFFAAQFIAGPFIGRLSDRYGRIPVLIVSQIGTVISFLMLGFATTPEMLFFARILDGVTGGNIIVAQAYVTDVVPREQRTQSLSYIFAAFGVGFIFGPAVGGILASTFSYEAPYIIAAIAATVVVILTWFKLDETITPEKRAQILARHEPKMTISDAFHNFPLLTILLVAFGAQLAFAMLQSTFSLFGEVVLFADNPGQVEAGVGILFATVGIGQVFTALVLVKRVFKDFDDGMLGLIGGVIRCLSLVVLVVAPFVLPAGVALFLFAMGIGLQMPALQSLITSTVPDGQRGAVLGLYQSATSLSIIVGSAIAGLLFAVSPYVPYIVGAVIFGLMIVPSYFLMIWSRKQDKSTPIIVEPSAQAIPLSGD